MHGSEQAFEYRADSGGVLHVVPGEVEHGEAVRIVVAQQPQPPGRGVIGQRGATQFLDGRLRRLAVAGQVVFEDVFVEVGCARGPGEDRGAPAM